MMVGIHQWPSSNSDAKSGIFQMKKATNSDQVPRRELSVSFRLIMPRIHRDFSLCNMPALQVTFSKALG